MDVSGFPEFKRAQRAAPEVIANRVAAALERQKSEREADLLGPSFAGSLSLMTAGWFAGAFWPMLVVVALRILPDFAAQVTARKIVARIGQGDDFGPLRARAEAIALLTGFCWGLATWPVHGVIFSNIGAFLVYVSVDVTGIIVMFMTVPSPDTLKRWIVGWMAAMAAPAAFAFSATSVVLAITSGVFASVLLWLSRRLHTQLRQFVTLQFENEDLARELGEVNAALAHSLAESERNARRDSLTGLNNRRAFEVAVVKLHRDCGHVGQHLLLIDLDHFKRISDSFGHASGDAALAAVSAVLSEEMRAGECCARWGGEEFVALVLECDLRAATARAENLRKKIATRAIRGWPRKMPLLTASIGVAAWKIGEPLEQVVARADMAMYEAKNSGRNRVHAASSATIELR